VCTVVVGAIVVVAAATAAAAAAARSALNGTAIEGVCAACVWL
jgi:hypothetical protein